LNTLIFLINIYEKFSVISINDKRVFVLHCDSADAADAINMDMKKNGWKETLSEHESASLFPSL